MFTQRLPVQRSTMKRRKVGTDRALEQTSSTFAAITDLPYELLAKIVEDLVEDEIIYGLSLTCKRLHFLVLPIFFSRNKLKSPECGFFHYYQPPPKTLEVVRTALFVRNLSALTFQFTSNVDQGISEMGNLRGLLIRIPPVGDISLCLPYRLSCQSFQPREVRNRNVERWGREFLKLLGTIVEMGCRELGLYDPGACCHKSLSIPLPSATEHTTVPVDSRRLQSRVVPLKSGQTRKPGLAADPPLTGIATLKILSSRFFQPFFIGWIIDTLERSRESIVCVAFNVSYPVPSALLSQVSESLNLPAVKEVSIVSDYDVHRVDLRPLLNRHPSITILYLDGTLPPENLQYPDARISLPCLTQLTATPPIVTWLLQRRNVMPLLTSVDVLLKSTLEPNSNDDALQAVAIHSHIASLQLTIGAEVDILSLMARHVHEDKTTRIITSLNHIKSVELDRICVPSPSPLTLQRWLCLFPCLEHATFDFCLLDARLKLSAEAKHDIVTEFANQVSADRPTMKTLSITRSETVNLDDLRGMPGSKDGVRSAGPRKSTRVLTKKGKAQCSCN